MKEHELKQYGDFDQLDGKQVKGFLILTLIQKFSKSFHDLIDGKYIKSSNHELLGGSRI